MDPPLFMHIHSCEVLHTQQLTVLMGISLYIIFHIQQLYYHCGSSLPSMRIASFL